MHDLISRQAAIDMAIEAVDVWDGGYNTQRSNMIMAAINALPSAQPPLEEFEWCTDCKEYDQKNHCCHRFTKVILQTVEELKSQTQWIPVTERLPDEAYGCLVTVWDTNPVTMDEFENILPYFVGWDGEQWNDGDGEQCPFEVIAWMPLPEPHKNKEGQG